MSTIAATNLKNPSSGSNNIVLNTDGTTTVSTLSSTTITGTTIQGTIKSGTAVASTSGTQIDFTGLPSWVKRVTVMLNGVSTSGTAFPRIQLGVGSTPTTSGYSTQTSSLGNGSLGTSSSASGFDLYSNTATYALVGPVVFTNVSSNTWVGSGTLSYINLLGTLTVAGSVTLAGSLGMVRITTVNGTDTFDAGTINLLWEG